MDYYIDGPITEVPNTQNNHHYKVVWDVIQFPDNFPRDGMCNNIFKSKWNLNAMKESQLRYDNEHPDAPPFRLNPNTTIKAKSEGDATKKQADTKKQQPISQADVTVTSLRMLPPVSLHTPTAMNQSNTRDEDKSKSGEGSDIEFGDADNYPEECDVFEDRDGGEEDNNE